MSAAEAYRDRNLVLALFALHVHRAWEDGAYSPGWGPVWLGVDPEEDPREWVVLFIETPAGQLSWHLPRLEADDYFAGILTVDEEAEADLDDLRWDGHTTEAKRARIVRLLGGF